ncbi:EamA-like transporter family protein [Aquimixticola soesokkakensis]|uniref:EamA-like transporter family protein n=1 Tax=Aquimixticola soesokkakensis TaxID=1519096 RepID=A0A1Y5T671_9RHOB|nr:DMT family transporter [Aquimixticola soesokkakensis]SLN56225.1 EamA-like transporter family protein [Aquimixticola soesokkakensis]
MQSFTGLRSTGLRQMSRQSARTSGWGAGLIGMLIFSGSLPATRLAVSQLTPLFLTGARAVIAALIAAALLLLLRQPMPARRDAASLVIVALGVVAGFPLLTALALQQIDAAHSVVFIGLLPLSTALFGVLRGGERPRAAFWLFSLMGSLSVAGFALWQARGGGASLLGDAYMLAAIAVCGLGYAEGATLSRRLGGWQVICWALIVAAAPMLVLALVTRPDTLAGLPAPVWAGLGYVSVFSMLIGFVFWYRGLALGGIAGVGQLQLLQPFFGLLLSALVLGETVALGMVAVTGFTVACVAGAKRFA